MKFLGINLLKDFQDLATKICGTLLKEIKKTQIVSIFPKLTNWYNVILAKKSYQAFFVGTGKLTLKQMWILYI